VIITLHSYKGGTGKTLLSVNLAMIYASRGKNVCLLDLDLRAPSLSSAFKNEKKYWINDYLNRTCEIDNVLNDCTPDYIKEGKIFIGLASPDTNAIREITAKNRKWEMEALCRLFNLKTSLINKMGFDYVILDSSPGLQYSSINTIVVADLVLVVTSIDKSDVQGTKRMIQDLYELFEKKTGIIVNKVPEAFLSARNAVKVETHQLPVVGFIPCSCDVLQSGGEYLFTFQRPHHVVTKTLERIASKIENLRESSESNLVTLSPIK
jgi:septum site-determining protein MinD